MTLVELVLAFGGGGLVTGAGVKAFDLLTKRGGEVVKTVIKERRIANVELTGNAQEDVAKVTEWALREFKAAQGETNDLRAEMRRLEIENATLHDAFEKMKEARADALRANTELVRQVSDLVEQAKSLASKMAAKEIEFAKLSIVHEGAKARIEQLQATIAEMQQFIDDATAREAKLESENERLRAR